MMDVAEIASWSVDERLRLVEAIWDTIAAAPQNLELTTAQQDELERRGCLRSKPTSRHAVEAGPD